MRRSSGGLPAFLIVLAIALAAAAAEDRVQFAPKFSPGETLRYGIESRTTTTGKTTTPISDPEGGSSSKQMIHLVVRLDVMDVRPATAKGGGAVRLRATYEKSSAETQSDSFDPGAAAFSAQYSRLEGHAFQFTIGPAGDISEFQGLDDTFRDRSTADPVLAWLQNISPANALPQGGIAVGQKWKSELPLPNAPLVGLFWQTESTYLRNELCGSSAAEGAGNHPAGDSGQSMCAAILTRFEIASRRTNRADQTPQDYLRNGLRTSGTWAGSGESLDSVSLNTGLLVSSTETSTQNIDYTIASAGAGAKSSVHRVGQIQMQSDITLLPNQE